MGLVLYSWLILLLITFGIDINTNLLSMVILVI